MKRYAFLAIFLLLVVSSSGCRRGLRLWGVRGGPCAPAYAGAVPRTVLPPQFPQTVPVAPTAVAPAAPCCPTPTCTPCPTDCGCPTTTTTDPAYDPAYGISAAPPSNIPGFVPEVGPNETFGGVVSDTGMVAPEGTVLPADTAPQIMGRPYGFTEPGL